MCWVLCPWPRRRRRWTVVHLSSRLRFGFLGLGGSAPSRRAPPGGPLLGADPPEAEESKPESRLKVCDGPTGLSPSGETAGQSIPQFIFSCKRDRGIWVGIALLVNKLSRACHWRGLFCFRPPGAICPPSLVLRGSQAPLGVRLSCVCYSLFIFPLYSLFHCWQSQTPAPRPPHRHPLWPRALHW